MLVNAPWPGFVGQRNYASDHARHDWVLALDADERVTPALRDEIQGCARGGFEPRRLPHPAGRALPGPLDPRHGLVPGPQLRLYDRRRGRWQGALVHESVRVDGTVGRLRGDLEHFTYRDVSHHMQTIDRYTTLWAEQAYAEGRRAGALTAAFTCGLGLLPQLRPQARLPAGQRRPDRLHAERVLHVREAGQAAERARTEAARE